MKKKEARQEVGQGGPTWRLVIMRGDEPFCIVEVEAIGVNATKADVYIGKVVDLPEALEASQELSDAIRFLSWKEGFGSGKKGAPEDDSDMPF
jgi:hypothetical protein